MIKKLIRTGNSRALTIDKVMQEHLGITGEVEVQFIKGKLILTRPLTVTEASARSAEKFAEAYKRLAR